MSGPMASATAGITGSWNGPVATTTWAAWKVSPSACTANPAPSLVTLVTLVWCRIGNPNAVA